jgi:hypothetical protein
MQCKDCGTSFTPESKDQKKLRRCLSCYRTFNRLKRARIRASKNQQQRICPDCSHNHSAPGYCGEYCADCFRKRETKRKAGWRTENRETDRVRIKRWRNDNLPKVAEGARRRSRRLRMEVITAYGGKCACPDCDVTTPEFLSVDHKNGGGNKHRRQLSGRSHGGTQHLYRWLKTNDFPRDNFQLLCRNCNAAKSEHGSCPHTWATQA